MKKIFRKYFLIFAILFNIPIFVNKVYAQPPEFIVKFMVKNDCYKYGKKTVHSGIMVHSTASPGIMARDWFILWNKSFKDGVGEEKGKEVCVHAFLDDKTVCQYLPWSQRGWHCGRAYKGGPSANDTHISFEICEPSSIKYDENHVKIIEYDPMDKANKEYFDAVWENAIWLCANLCHNFKINPREIISHQEGYILGIASNHGDPKHWWDDYHGKDMDMFRMNVFRELMHRIFNKILEDDCCRRYFFGHYSSLAHKNLDISDVL